MVCEEKAIEYVLTERPRTREILAIHPFGKMPVLRHGDVELFESKAIATYLDRSFPAPFVFRRTLTRRAHRAMGLARQHGDGPHPHSDISLRIYRAWDADGAPDREAIEAVLPRCANRSGFSTRRSPRPLSRQRAVHLRRHQSAADPPSRPEIAGRREALANATHLARYYDRHAARRASENQPAPGPPRRESRVSARRKSDRRQFMSSRLVGSSRSRRQRSHRSGQRTGRARLFLLQ